MPVTKPSDDPIVTFPLLLLQVPPGVMSLKVTDAPTQAFSVPAIRAGSGSTVMGKVAVQPVESV